MFDKKRTNTILCSGGFKGSGKTYQTLHIIDKYVFPKNGQQPRKVIIFDTNGEYNNDSIIKAGLNFH